MEEIRRILFGRRRVLLLLILVLYSAIQFCKPLQYGLVQSDRAEVDRYLAAYGDLPIEEAKTQLDKLTGFGNDTGKLGFIGSEMYRQVAYVLDYPEFLRRVQEQAGTLIGVSIFKSNDATIIKTADDYKRMEGAVLTMGHDYAVTSVLEYDKSDWLLSIYIVVIVLSFMRERKRGMWNLVCASPNGRGKLPLLRAASLAIAAITGAVLFTAVEVVGGWVQHGGMDEMGRMVQSVSMLKSFTIPMTTGQFWLFYTALRALGAFAIGALVWLFFEIIPDRRISAIALALFVGLEWTLFTLLPQENLLKIVNLFLWMAPRNLLLSYVAIDPFGFAIGRLEAALLGAGIVAVFAMAVALVCCRYRKPNGGFAWIARINDFWRRHTAAIGFHGKLFFHETHKLLVVGRGLLVVAAALLLCYSVAESPYLRSDSQVNMHLEAYYRQSQGPVSEENEVFVQTQRDKLASLQEEYEELVELYEEGYLTESEFGFRAMQYSNLWEKEEALAQYEAHLDTLKSVPNAHILPHWVYAELFGTGSSKTVGTLTTISVVAILLICGLYSSTEASTGMTKVRRATLKGRKQALIARYGAACLLTVVVCAVVWGLQILLLDLSYEGLPCLMAPICSLQYFREASAQWSILGYWLVQAAGRTLMLCIASCALLWGADRLQK